MAFKSFSDQKIELRDADGKLVELRYNEPRPDLEVRKISSRLVATDALGVAGLRLRVEQLLDQSCGKDHTASVVALGPAIAPVLIKIAGAKAPCDCGCVRRGGALRVLGYFPQAEVADFLKRIVSDESEEIGVRAEAAIATGRIGSPSCVAHLQEVLRKDKSIALRRAAARGLGLSRSLEAISALAQAVEKDKAPAIKAQAYASLRAIEKLHGQRLSLVKAPPVPKGGKPERKKAPKPTNDRTKR